MKIYKYNQSGWRSFNESTKDKKGNNSGTFKIATRGFKVENGFKNTPGLKNILQLEPFNPKKEDIEYIENLLMSMKK